MRRLALLVTLLLAAAAPAQAIITFGGPYGEWTCEYGVYRLGVELARLDPWHVPSNGTQLLRAYREVLCYQGDTSAGCSDIVLTATEVLDPQNPPHEAREFTIGQWWGTSRVPENCSLPGPDVYWSMDGYVWRTTECDPETLAPKFHNGTYLVKVSSAAKFWTTVPHCGDPDASLDRYCLMYVQVHNLLITSVDTPAVLKWQQGGNAPSIPVTLQDDGPLAGTNLVIAIYPVGGGGPVRTLTPTVNGSTTIEWDGKKDDDTYAPDGLYVYTLSASHSESEWECAEGGQPPWYWDPVDCLDCERTGQPLPGPGGIYLDRDTKNSTLTISGLAAQMGKPAGSSASGVKLTYTLSREASVCGVRVYDQDLTEMEVEGQDELPTAAGVNSHVIEMALDPETDYYFVVYAKDADRDNKGHLHKPALERGTVLPAGSSSQGSEYGSGGYARTVSDWHGTTTYEYDTLGRVVKVTDPDGKWISYEYDLSSKRTKMVDHYGGETTYQYDARGLLEHIIDRNGGATDYEYYDNGMLKKVTNPNGTYVEYAYNNWNGLTSLVNRMPDGSVLAGLTFYYDSTDANGNSLPGRKLVTRVVEDVRLPDPNPQNLTAHATLSYAYDNLYSIQREQRVGDMPFDRNYEYDPFGNRVSKIEKDPEGEIVSVTAYATDDANRLVEEGGASYTYDSGPNTITRTEGVHVARYFFNTFFQLIRIEQDGQVVARFAYDGLGQRIRYTDADGVTFDARYDLASIVSEEAGEELYHYLLDELGFLNASTGPELTRYYHFNDMGDTCALTGVSPDVAESWAATYDIFGVIALVSPEQLNSMNRASTLSGWGILEHGDEHQPFKPGGEEGNYTLPVEPVVSLPGGGDDSGTPSTPGSGYPVTLQPYFPSPLPPPGLFVIEAAASARPCNPPPCPTGRIGERIARDEGWGPLSPYAGAVLDWVGGVVEGIPGFLVPQIDPYGGRFDELCASTVPLGGGVLFSCGELGGCAVRGIGSWLSRLRPPYRVYAILKDDTIIKVGRTGRGIKRILENYRLYREYGPLTYTWLKQGLTYEESRMWEQMFIDDFGLDNLLNEMNGVARKNRWWDKLGPP